MGGGDRLEAMEARLELRLSPTAASCLGVFAIQALAAGTALAYPAVIMTERMHGWLLREKLAGDLHTGVQFQLDEESSKCMRRHLFGFTAVGWPLRKGVLLNSANSSESELQHNCRLMQMNDDQLLVTAPRAFRSGRGPLPNHLVYVELTREVAAGEELLLYRGPINWQRHQVSVQSPEPANLPSAAAASASSSSTSLSAAPPPSPRIPCLPSGLEHVPIELLSLGISSWMRTRLQSHSQGGHRLALDEALAELAWELADQLTDGDRLALPEFKRARRSESRHVAAAHNVHMEAERRCTMLHNILRKLAEAGAERAPAT